MTLFNKKSFIALAGSGLLLAVASYLAVNENIPTGTEPGMASTGLSDSEGESKMPGVNPAMARDPILGTMTDSADGLEGEPDRADELQRGLNRPSNGPGTRGIRSPDSRV